MDVWQVMASVISGGAILQLGKLGLDWIKTNSAENRADEAQEFSQQEQLIADLRARIVELERHTADCMKAHAETLRNLGRLEGMIDEQRDSMKHLQRTSTEATREAVKVAGEVAAQGVLVAAQLAASDSATRLAAAGATPAKPTADTQPDLNQIHEE